VSCDCVALLPVASSQACLRTKGAPEARKVTVAWAPTGSAWELVRHSGSLGVCWGPTVGPPTWPNHHSHLRDQDEALPPGVHLDLS
jgi:hypothetical protein